jgi:hypothetical protein
MTLGDFVMYMFFTGLMAAPVVQIASIGTQITEAFAGLDRIREIRDDGDEDDEDATRAAAAPMRGDVAFEDVWFEYNPGVPVLKGVSFRAGGHDDGAGRVERLGQEHAHQPGDGVQPAEDPGGCSWTGATCRPSACAITAAARRRAAGQLPVRRHGRREHRYARPTRPGTDPRGQPHRARDEFIEGFETSTTPSSGSAA